MTNEEHARLVEAELAKAKLIGPVEAYESEDDWLRGIIGTAIADTVLIVEDGAAISAFEQPVSP